MPVCMLHPPQGLWGFRPLGQGTVAHLLSPPARGPPVGGLVGGLCVPGVGPSSGTGGGDTTAAGGVCGSDGLRLPLAHN